MLFAEKPLVRRAFEKNVPRNMSDKVFWERYLKYELAQEVRAVPAWGPDSVWISIFLPGGLESVWISSIIIIFFLQGSSP